MPLTEGSGCAASTKPTAKSHGEAEQKGGGRGGGVTDGGATAAAVAVVIAVGFGAIVVGFAAGTWGARAAGFGA